MTLQRRSLDDLPLAAYTTGMQPDPRLEGPKADPASPTDPGSAAATTPVTGEFDLSTEPGGAGGGMPALPPLPVWLAHPRAHVRDPRLLLSAAVAVGAVLFALSLLTGGGPLAADSASPTPGTLIAAVTPEPPKGDASVEIEGKTPATYALVGVSGSGAAVASRIDATWADASGATLGLRGRASPGTRTTDVDFVLTWTILVEGAPVTFQSNSGECTVGMAVQSRSVNGTFVCKKLTSDDGELTVDARGTYRT